MTISVNNQVVTLTTRDKATFYDIIITDESTGDKVTKVVTPNEVGNYQEINLDFTPLKNNFYTLEVTDNNKIVYKSKIYCTDEAKSTDYKTKPQRVTKYKFYK